MEKRKISKLTIGSDFELEGKDWIKFLDFFWVNQNITTYDVNVNFLIAYSIKWLEHIADTNMTMADLQKIITPYIKNNNLRGSHMPFINKLALQQMDVPYAINAFNEARDIIDANPDNAVLQAIWGMISEWEDALGGNGDNDNYGNSGNWEDVTLVLSNVDGFDSDTVRLGTYNEEKVWYVSNSARCFNVSFQNAKGQGEWQYAMFYESRKAGKSITVATYPSSGYTTDQQLTFGDSQKSNSVDVEVDWSSDYNIVYYFKVMKNSQEETYKQVRIMIDSSN